MGFFECCHYCTPPKRHLNCHDTCPEYLKQKKLWDERKEAEKQAYLSEPPMSYAQKQELRKRHKR